MWFRPKPLCPAESSRPAALRHQQAADRQSLLCTMHCHPTVVSQPVLADVAASSYMFRYLMLCMAGNAVYQGTQNLTIQEHCVTQLVALSTGTLPASQCPTCRDGAFQGPQHHGAVRCHPHSAHHLPTQAACVCWPQGPHLTHAVQGPQPAHYPAPSHDAPLDNPQQQPASAMPAGTCPAV